MKRDKAGDERKSHAVKSLVLLVILLVAIVAVIVAFVLFGPTNEGNNTTIPPTHPFEYSVSKDGGTYVVSLVSIYGELTSDYDMTTEYAIWKDNNIVYPASGSQSLYTIKDGVINDTVFVSYSDVDNDQKLSAGDKFSVSTELASEDGYLLGLSADPSIEWYWLKLEEGTHI